MRERQLRATTHGDSARLIGREAAAAGLFEKNASQEGR
jgi:hypothetical protein